MSETLQEKNGILSARQKSFFEIYDAKKEAKNWTRDEVDEMQRLNREMTALREEIDTIKSVEEIADKARQFEAKQSEVKRTVPFAGAQAAAEAAGQLEIVEAKSLGELFVASPAFKNYSKANRRSPEADFDLKTVFQTTTANTGSVGFAPEIIRNGIIMPYVTRTPKMDTVIPPGSTDGPSILYMEETVWVNGAVFVGEDDTLKGESELKYEEKIAPVRKIRVSLPVSDDMMSDAPQMMSYVNSRLMNMLSLKKDQALISGTGAASGNGAELVGLVNTPGILNQAKGTDTPLDAIHKGITKVAITSELPSTAVVMHPQDWEKIILEKSADGVYLYGSPTQAVPQSLWGLRVVDTTGITAGTALLGAFDTAVQQYTRQGVTMSVSTEHEDYWMRGRLGIKLEMRLALVVYRPSGLCLVSGL